jgi:hypothetical protein
LIAKAMLQNVGTNPGTLIEFFPLIMMPAYPILLVLPQGCNPRMWCHRNRNQVDLP